MLFNVEIDEGSRITGYVVPDSFSNSSSLSIVEYGNEVAVLPCTDERGALVVAGRHATGRCGFCIDDSIVPDLASRHGIELYDIESGILIYRRRPIADISQKRLFRLETHLLPLWRFDDTAQRRFQFFYKGIERFGQETSTQVFVLNNSSSLYVSGSLTVRAYEYYLYDGVFCIAMLRDPYLELAERLLVLKQVPNLQNIQLFGEREMMGFKPAIDFAQQIEVDKGRLRTAFSSMPKAAIARLGNPVTRLLAARNPDEVPMKGAVAGALRTLSSFAIVGLREYQNVFFSQMSELIDVPADAFSPISEIDTVINLAEMLRSVPEAEVLMEQDLQVYFHVKSAIESMSEDV